MNKIGLNELRSIFLEYYKGKDHYIKKSFSLVPENDKSLLIINSGMAPLKHYFSGALTPPGKRMATCQKCIRTGDIENVGHTARHGTFFEMLGSFSFGDYFKKESLVWGYELLTDILKLPEDRLWASIYEDDEEAYAIWHDVIGFPEERIVRLGKEDNFWEIGIGPCGPCSEIYYDRGKGYGCDKKDCKPGCDCDRYIEFWNHVFTQFNKDEAGNYTPLKHKNIDTGMGLERLACIMQQADSIFDVDTVRIILDEVEKKSTCAYEGGKTSADTSMRIITDHIRSITFMICDGILPGNEGRGYVLRRLLRRAARHGKLLGIKEGFLSDLSEKVIHVSKEAYPELAEKKDYIQNIIFSEEKKFSNTIDQGSVLLAEHMERMKDEDSKILSGEIVFQLYDTFGFPPELVWEILEEQGCKADIAGFEKHMKRQRESARAARKSQEKEGWMEKEMLHLTIDHPTIFTGYNELSGTGKIIGIYKENLNADSLTEGETGLLVLNETPFYAEGGGQAADTGIIFNDDALASVHSVVSHENAIFHMITVERGTLQTDSFVHTRVDLLNRNKTARNHTGTHLLHQALKEVVGPHVEQAGSHVSPAGLRFDFNHYEGLGKEKLQEIEDLVNEKIDEFLPVYVREMPLAQAIETGAAAQFGEKYKDIVRVVSAGEFSHELCGGTHVENTGQIGAMKIVSEGGIASGVRRIEAVTGTELNNRLHEAEAIIAAASKTLKSTPDNFLSKFEQMAEEWRLQRKNLLEQKEKSLSDSVDQIINRARQINGINLITWEYVNYEAEDLRLSSDKIRDKIKNAVIILASNNGDRANFIVAVTDDLIEKGYHAGKLVKPIAAAAGGGGGGKADLAQAGAKDPKKIALAFAVAETLL